MPTIQSSLLDAELDRCTTLLGQPLTNDVRGRLHRLWDSPTPETWDAAYSVVLNDRGATIWQAVTLTTADHARPLIIGDRDGRRLWSNVPDRPSIYTALQYAAAYRERAR